MKSSKASSIEEHFYVIGIGLPPMSRERLTAAFPHCILYRASNNRSETRELCEFLGRVVIFAYIPAMGERIHVRTSAVFHMDRVKVIGVHHECTEALYDSALESELAGVLCDDVDAATFRRAAFSVQRGELWFPRSYLSRRTREAVSSNSSSGLSAREADILPLLAAGCTNQHIADSLYISRDTVRWHLRSIYAKLGVSDREAALRLATNKTAPSGRDAAPAEHTFQTMTLRKGG